MICKGNEGEKTSLRYPQPHKPGHLLTTRDTAAEIVHRQTHPAVFAHAETAAGPGDDGPWVGLADDALRPVGSKP